MVANADVLIDFSLPEALDAVLAAALRHKKPLVCGVSGFDDVQREAIATAAERIPIVFDRNMSQGIAALHVALECLAQSLGICARSDWFEHSNGLTDYALTSAFHLKG